MRSAAEEIAKFVIQPQIRVRDAQLDFFIKALQDYAHRDRSLTVIFTQARISAENVTRDLQF